MEAGKLCRLEELTRMMLEDLALPWLEAMMPARAVAGLPPVD